MLLVSKFSRLMFGNNPGITVEFSPGLSEGLIDRDSRNCSSWLPRGPSGSCDSIEGELGQVEANRDRLREERDCL